MTISFFFLTLACSDVPIATAEEPGIGGSVMLDTAEPASGPSVVDADGDSYDDTTDCDDTSGSVFPGAQESCNGVDDDCDDAVDEGLELPTWFVDDDGDGFGLEDGAVAACAAPEGTVDASGDCDDADASVHPGAEESCNGTDDDCDAIVDEDVEHVVGYADHDADGYGGGDPIEACALEAGQVTEPGDCDDLSPAVHPGAIDVCNDGVDGDCDGAVPAGCLLEGVHGLETGDAVISGWEAGDAYGAAISASGDLDGNGTNDLVVSAPVAESSASSASSFFSLAMGVVYVSLDPPAGHVDSNEAEVTFQGPGLADIYGGALTAGDLDADGYDDLVIGLPSRSGSSSDQGEVQVVFGPFAAGDVFDGSNSAATTLTYGESGASIGSSLAVAGDVDGDGFDDLLVGGEGADHDGYSAVGAVFLVSGPIDGSVDLAEAEAKIFGVTNIDGFDSKTTAGTDLDGDGLAEVVMAIPETGTDSGSMCGVVAVFEGPVAGEMTIDSADTRIVGGGTLDFLGEGLATVPDQDGDGYAEMLIGAPKADPVGTNSGAAYLWNGPMTGGEIDPTSAVATWTGELTYDEAGQTVASGDVDGDGTPDFVIGAPGWDDSDAKGTVYLSYGPASGTTSLGSADATFLGESTNDHAGAALATSDIDGDGHADILVGAAGHDDGSNENAGSVYLWSGLGL